ncbi:MAG: hypothetical protein IPG60_08295 [Bacteroidetes bacterium]|nr:hypothetical protein [Bacteroidota bacterium]MBP7400358.1 hypothetical protein [Chitinophagales bacterium]MBK7110745.1 hypothetical protein [Bacteroidota bacterium]MBK8488036.1 hypothetical protein [Bacteroidota bacterium]MBP8755010.1 hypothetical protein [Chitinophagales bacterium]
MDNNSTGKYLKYAVGEIVLVVIGILIALQINNWNIDRINHKREIKYLQNINLDLQKDIVALQFQLNFRTKKKPEIEKIISQINGAPIEDLNELAYNVIISLYEERFAPSNITYKELVSSGNLNLITNDSIKKLLLELELLHQYNILSIDHETYDYREYVSKPLFEYTDMGKLLPVFLGDKTAEEQQITKEDFTELLQSKEYQNGLLVTNWTTTDFITLYQNIDAKSKRIVELIDVELKK